MPWRELRDAVHEATDGLRDGDAELHSFSTSACIALPSQVAELDDDVDRREELIAAQPMKHPRSQAHGQVECAAT